MYKKKIGRENKMPYPHKKKKKNNNSKKGKKKKLVNGFDVPTAVGKGLAGDLIMKGPYD